MSDMNPDNQATEWLENIKNIDEKEMARIKEACLKKIREDYDAWMSQPKGDDEHPTFVHVYNEDDIKKISESARKVRVEYNFNGEISKVIRTIGKYPKIASLEIKQSVPCIMLDDDSLENVRDLYIDVDINDTFSAFSIPGLTSLTIYCNGHTDLFTDTSVDFDFSLFPQLKWLNIGSWSNLNLESLKTLRKLQYLRVGDLPSDNLEWLKYLPQLETLDLRYPYKSVEPIIQYQDKLKEFHSRGDCPKDIGRLALLKEIELINVYKAKVDPEQEKLLRSMDETDIIINKLDDVLCSAKYSAHRLPGYAAYNLYKRDTTPIDKLLSNRLPFIADRIRAEIELDWEERAMLFFQRAFVSNEPANYYSYDLELEPYRMQIHQRYIRSALAEFPFLDLTEDMKEIMNGIEPKSFEIPDKVLEERAKAAAKKAKEEKERKEWEESHKNEPEQLSIYSLLDNNDS